MNRAFHGICIAGTHSGTGKTTLTLGILAALRARGMHVQPFKCGPDFIDPAHHALAAGRESRNLDTWMMGEDAVRAAYARANRDADAAVIEGVMGLFDGASPRAGEGSTAHVCRVLDVPVVLVVNAGSMARSIAALVHGFASFDPALRTVGVVANQVGSKRHAQILRDALDAARLPPLLGSVPKNSEWITGERHLGLVTASESGHDARWFADLAAGIESHLDLDRLLSLCRSRGAPAADAGTAGRGEANPEDSGWPTSVRARLGVALDKAFQFYYADNLDLLRAHGVEIVFFSPLRDRALPAGLAGLYLGGGYPEIHAEKLAANREMRAAIRNFANGGKPVYAECGGLMYLCASLRDRDGRDWAMCGALPMRAVMGNRLRRLGYVEAETLRDGLFGTKGTRIRGHEYHWSEMESGASGRERLFTVRTPRGNSSSPTGWKCGSVWASYLHLHFASNPAAARAWAAALNSGAGT